MNKLRLCATLGSLWFAAGCADANSVLFVTVTNIGIDADTKPANVTIGYDRYEGYLGPVYASGALPPVVARLESNLSVFNPEIRQVYATGEAAKLVTEQNPASPTAIALKGDKRLAIVATGTNIGLKVTFTANAPESISFGYKRKEFSLIPLVRPAGAGDGHEDKYGSALASIDLNLNTPSLTNTALGVSQFFATGIAAEQLARTNPEIRRTFKRIAQDAIARTSADFGEDDNSNRLIRAIEADPDFRNDLKQWITDDGLGISTTLLISGKEFSEARARAVEDLLTPR